jgi:hypothetical protein
VCMCVHACVLFKQVTSDCRGSGAGGIFTCACVLLKEVTSDCRGSGVGGIFTCACVRFVEASDK